MKHLFILSVCLLHCFVGSAQDIDSSKVGTIEYYEGKVLIGNGAAWTNAKINGDVKKHQTIRTMKDAMAEITWNSGVKTIVGPESQHTILSLMNGSSGDTKHTTKGTFQNFKRIFAENQSDGRTQEGGIRRDEADKKEKPAKDEMYWKQEDEIDFKDAWDNYDAGDYASAIRNFETFIRQKPGSDHIKQVYFALAHSYIMSNNSVKAKEILNRFIIEFPDDAFTIEASKMIADMK